MPSSILVFTSSGEAPSRKAILFCLHASNTLARASTKRGCNGASISRFKPKDICRSEGPHSAKAMPGTDKVCSTFEIARTDSSFNPKRSSPFLFKGQGSAFCIYSSLETPQTRAAQASDPTPRVPSPSPFPSPSRFIG